MSLVEGTDKGKDPAVSVDETEKAKKRSDVRT